MACNEAVYLAGMIIVMEYANRLYFPLIVTDFEDFHNHCTVLFSLFFIITSIICLACSFKLPGTEILESSIFLKCTSYLYMLDSVAAVGLGYSLIQRNIAGVCFSMFFLTNMFMLHIVNKVFVGKKPTDTKGEMSAMLKSFIHHTSSFLFLDSRDGAVIAVTTVWRALSMSGHTAQSLSLNKHISAEQLYRFNWALSHARNLYVVVILALCWQYPHIRAGFGRSAVGHVAYMQVRAGPVFRLGSVYVGDRPLWQGLSDAERIATLLRGKHMFLTLEVGSLTVLMVLFTHWRFFNAATV